MVGFTVEVRDKDLTRVGQIAPEHLNLKLIERFNNVGEWTLTLPAQHPMAAALRTPGAGIIVTRDDGMVIASGPVVSPEAVAAADDPAGTVTFTGATDNILLADRLAHPAPDTLDPTDAAYDVVEMAAESAIHYYVGRNLGFLAHPSRWDWRVTIGHGDEERGAVRTYRARFQQLGAFIADIAAGADYPTGTGRPFGFRLVQETDNAIYLRTYPVRDQSAEVRFDVFNNTLASHKVATAAPTATHVVVAGQGEGTDRTIMEVTTPDSEAASAAWARRIEVFRDQRQTDDTGELTAAGYEVLADAGFGGSSGDIVQQLSIQVTPADDTRWTFGTDWFLGDYVTVVVDGAELSAVVTGFALQIDASGTRLGAMLGSLETSELASIERRLSNLERTAEGGSAPAVDPLPAGGDTGDVLTKLSGTDGDAGWASLRTLLFGDAEVKEVIGSTSTAELTNSTSYVPATNHGTEFVAPPSGVVNIMFGGWIGTNGTTQDHYSHMSIEVRTGSTVGSGTSVLAADDEHSVIYRPISDVTGIKYAYLAMTYRLSGLTPGETYNVRTVFKTSDSAANAYVRYRRLRVEPALI